MNTFKKFCPNVYVAQCTEQHQKGDIIAIINRYGKEKQYEVYNLVAQSKEYFFYSITPIAENSKQSRIEKKIENMKLWAENAKKRSIEQYEKAQEGQEFLSLGEPIKIGHHSENSHRKMIERRDNRMKKSVKEQEKAEEYKNQVEYWENRKNDIDLSMPESLQYFAFKVKNANEELEKIKKENYNTLIISNAKRRLKELQKKFEIAKVLWG